MRGLLTLNNTLKEYRYLSNIRESSDGSSASIETVGGVPCLKISSSSNVLTFEEVMQVGAWVTVALDYPVHFVSLEPATITFLVFDPSGTYSLEQLAQGLDLDTWLDEADERTSDEEPYQPIIQSEHEVLPTKAYDFEGFLRERHNDFRSTVRTGKWCIIRTAADVDALWVKVRRAVREGVFPGAMVSTPSQTWRHGGTYVICVFTHDWQNKPEVDAAREVLRSMGVNEVIGYKRDLDTANSVYGTDEEWTYHA